MHQSIVQYTLTCCPGRLGACLRSSGRSWSSLVYAGTWGDARQLAQVEVAQARVEVFLNFHVVAGALQPALQRVWS